MFCNCIEMFGNKSEQVDSTCCIQWWPPIWFGQLLWQPCGNQTAFKSQGIQKRKLCRACRRKFCYCSLPCKMIWIDFRWMVSCTIDSIHGPVSQAKSMAEAKSIHQKWANCECSCIAGQHRTCIKLHYSYHKWKRNQLDLYGTVEYLTLYWHTRLYWRLL